MILPWARSLPFPQQQRELGEPNPSVAETGAAIGGQLEELLHTVWNAEADWRFNDRLDLAR